LDLERRQGSSKTGKDAKAMHQSSFLLQQPTGMGQEDELGLFCTDAELCRDVFI